MELSITSKQYIDEKLAEKTTYEFEVVDGQQCYGKGTITFNALEMEAPLDGDYAKVLEKYVSDLTSSLNTLGDKLVESTKKTAIK